MSRAAHCYVMVICSYSVCALKNDVLTIIFIMSCFYVCVVGESSFFFVLDNPLTSTRKFMLTLWRSRSSFSHF